ncbi:D-alanine-D-alanine ligase-like ATP-grasp enzyme [Virgibacillus natechei]|uniref:D-alanine-D-alanine ligase-like ATP-grasp enzyme n=2 Tax=Virgibacillus natechei TaxID=1216297 RepID=A0ABS4IKI9_9BACI|nr:D-alanine-D-alanine ligase-like ATP-grasp enzyme [Virgibacillus natechei]
MKGIEDKSLDQLIEIVPESAYGANATMFSVALEGWKRGLKLKFFKKYIKNRVKIRYSLSNEEREIKFQLSLAEFVPKETRNITRSKKNTKDYLLKADIPTPQGRSFSGENEDDEIINYAKTLEYPLVIKPVSASLGIGVTTNIYDEETFSENLKHLRGNKGYKEIIVEQQVTGEDTRLFVVGDQVVSAFKRIAANVIGDGKHTIKELIELKNSNRKKTHMLAVLKLKLMLR